MRQGEIFSLRWFFVEWYGDHRDLHSFPTRRSSDPSRLGRCTAMRLYDYAASGNCYKVRLLLRSEEHTSELQSRGQLVCRLLLEKKKKTTNIKQYSKKKRNEKKKQ